MRPGAGVFSAAFFALGAGLIDLVAVTKAESAMLGLMLAFLGVVQLGVVAAALARPTRRVLLAGGATSLVVLIYWWVSRSSGLLFGPAVWLAEDRLVGFTDVLGALLRLMAGLLFLVTAARGAGLARTGRWMILRTGVATALAALGAGVLTAASLAFITGGAAPSPTVTPTSAAAGQMTTFTYCTVEGVRWAMDVYEPAATVTRPAPAVLFVHGGTWIYGNRRSDGAYFDQMQTSLTGRGFVVASIDYGLGSLYPFPAQVEDAACAVRFLRAQAGALGVDPVRIGAWGASSGGTSVDLLAMQGTPTSWDEGEYAEQSSRVAAVVDMSGVADYPAQGRGYTGPSAILGKLVGASLFRDPEASAAASPVSYTPPTDVPFLIVHGTRDFVVPPAQSEELVQRLQAAGTPARLILVEGAGHVGFDPRMATEIPTAVDFLAAAFHLEVGAH